MPLTQFSPSLIAVILGSVFIFFFNLGLTVVLAQIPLRAFLQKHAEHWSERARYAYQTTRFLRWQHAVLMIGCIMLLIICVTRSGLTARTVAMGTLFGTSAFLGSHTARYFVIRRIYPSLRPLRVWIREVCVWFLPRLFILFLYFSIVYFLRMIFHNWQIVAVLAWLVTLLLYVYEGWSIGLRLVAGFRVASSRLSELVRAVSERASLPSPKVFEFDSVFPNAWAMPSRGMLLFSSALSETLDSEEQKAIIAHELAHLSETKAQIVGRLLPSFVGVPIAIGLYTLGAIVFRPLDFIDSIFLFCLTAFWVIFVIAILYHRFSERLEIAADKKAVLSEDSKGSYARALERIYEASLIPAILPKRRKTHPDLYDRLLASGISPSFSRPALPPKRELRIAATCSAIVCAWLFSIAIFAASRLVGLPRWEHLSRPVVERDER